jgi:hypothetical protein
MREHSKFEYTSMQFSSDADSKLKIGRVISNVGRAAGNVGGKVIQAAPKVGQVLNAASTVVPALAPAAAVVNAGVQIAQVLKPSK